MIKFNRIVFWLLAISVAPSLFLFSINVMVNLGYLDVPVGGHVLIGRDFVNYYASSLAIWENKLDIIYDVDAYYEFLKHSFGDNLSKHNASYPPHFWLFTWPLSFFPYLLSLILWSVFSVTVFYKSLELYGLPKQDIIILCLTPAIIICLIGGQNGLISAALILSAFYFKDNRPILAGFLLACLTYKPQMGFLIPLALMLSRDWKVIFWAGVFTVMLIVSSIIIFGTHVWLDYFHNVIPFQMYILENMGRPFNIMVPSIFKSLHNFGVNTDIAMQVQYVLGLLSVLIVIWAFWRVRNRDLQLALFLTATCMFSPYLVIYDLPILTFAAYLYYKYLVQTYSKQPSRLNICLVVSVIGLSYICFFIGLAGFSISPLIMIVFAIYIIRELRLSESFQRPKFQFSELKQILSLS